MPSEASVMPNWHGREVLADVVELVRAPARAPRSPSSAQLLEARAARAHERELGGDEEPVDENEQRRPRGARQRGHRGGRRGEPLLRGGRRRTSSDLARQRVAATQAGVGSEARRSAPASARSASVRPPSRWVESVRRTLFQPWTRMSGWWLAASATSATRLTNAIAAAKSSNSRSRTIASPSRATAVPPAASISSSAERHAQAILASSRCAS